MKWWKSRKELVKANKNLEEKLSYYREKLEHERELVSGLYKEINTLKLSLLSAKKEPLRIVLVHERQGEGAGKE